MRFNHPPMMTFIPQKKNRQHYNTNNLMALQWNCDITSHISYRFYLSLSFTTHFFCFTLCYTYFFYSSNIIQGSEWVSKYNKKPLCFIIGSKSLLLCHCLLASDAAVVINAHRKRRIKGTFKQWIHNIVICYIHTISVNLCYAISHNNSSSRLFELTKKTFSETCLIIFSAWSLGIINLLFICDTISPIVAHIGEYIIAIK